MHAQSALEEAAATCTAGCIPQGHAVACGAQAASKQSSREKKRAGMSERRSLLAPSTSPHPGCPCRSRPAGRTPPQRPSAGWAPSAGCPCRRCARGRASAAAAEGRRAGGRALPAWRRGWTGPASARQQVSSERRGGEAQGAPGLSGGRACSRLAALQPCHHYRQPLIVSSGWRWPGTGRPRACIRGAKWSGQAFKCSRLGHRFPAPRTRHRSVVTCRTAPERWRRPRCRNNSSPQR